MQFTTENQEALLNLTYELNKERVEISYDAYRWAVRGYDFMGLLKNGVVIGTVALNKDNNIHVSILPEHRKQWAGKWIRCLFKRLTQDNDLFTTVFHDDVFRLRFAKRLGFEEYKTTDNVTILKITKGTI